MDASHRGAASIRAAGALAREARRRNARLVLDSSGEALRAAGGEPIHLVEPKRSEDAELLGRPFADERDLRQGIEDFVRRGRAEAVVVSLGAEGALLATRDGTELCQRADVERLNAALCAAAAPVASAAASSP